MITQLLNNIKKFYQFISSLLYGKKLHERKEKKYLLVLLAVGAKADGSYGGWTHSYFGSFWGQD
jgi:hypothetical protein